MNARYDVETIGGKPFLASVPNGTSERGGIFGKICGRTLAFWQEIFGTNPTAHSAQVVTVALLACLFLVAFVPLCLVALWRGFRGSE